MIRFVTETTNTPKTDIVICKCVKNEEVSFNIPKVWALRCVIFMRREWAISNNMCMCGRGGGKDFGEFIGKFPLIIPPSILTSIKPKVRTWGTSALVPPSWRQCHQVTAQPNIIVTMPHGYLPLTLFMLLAAVVLIKETEGKPSPQEMAAMADTLKYLQELEDFYSKVSRPRLVK